MGSIVRHLYPLFYPIFEYLMRSLVNHTGFFTSLPTYSYFPLQTFFPSSEVAPLINTTEVEIRDKNLVPFYRKQLEKHLEWLKQGTVGQLEMALYAGK